MIYGPSEHACPRCREQLYVGHASGVTLHGCGRCGGVWLGTACASRIAEALPEDAIGLAGRVSKNAQGEVCTKAPILCPICSAPMTRTRAAAAGVDLDVCGVHGTWYDRDELERIAHALAHSSWKSGAKKGGHGAQAGVVGAVAGTAVAAGVAAHATHGAHGARNESALETAVDVAEVGAEVVLEGGAEVALEGAGAVAEGAGAVLEGAFEIMGGILGAIFD